MKKISYKDLGNYFKESAEKEFDGWYSEDTRDWNEDMMTAENNSSYDEEEELHICKLEVTKVGKQPLLIEYYVKYIYDEDDMVVDIEYYI